MTGTSLVKAGEVLFSVHLCLRGSLPAAFGAAGRKVTAQVVAAGLTQCLIVADQASDGVGAGVEQPPTDMNHRIELECSTGLSDRLRAGGNGGASNGSAGLCRN